MRFGNKSAGKVGVPVSLILLVLHVTALSTHTGQISSDKKNKSSDRCGFPIYCAYTGQALSDPFQWDPHSTPPEYRQPKVPNVGNLSRKYKDEKSVERTYGFRDTSYLNGSFSDSRKLPYVYRCTDAYTELGHDLEGPKALTFSPAIGNTGAGVAWNANSTLLHLATQTGGSYIIQHDPSNFICADRPVLFTKGVGNHGPNVAQEFGSGSFSFKDPSIWNKKRLGGTVVQFQINWTKLWQPGMKVNVGDVIAAVAKNKRSSCYYLATTEGSTGQSPPSFPVDDCGESLYQDSTAAWLGLGHRLKFCPDSRHPNGRAVSPGQWCRRDDSKGQPIIVADFTRALPISLENAPSWQPNHIYHFGDYVSFSLIPTQLGSTASGSACRTEPSAESCGWRANTRYNTGDIIAIGHCAYKVISVWGARNADFSMDGGVTGKSKPDFPNGMSTACDMQDYPRSSPVANSVVWRGLGGPPRFAFQLVTPTPPEGRQSDSQFPTSYIICPGWPRDVGSCDADEAEGYKSATVVTTHPDFMSFALDNGLIWVNVGPFVAPSAWTYSTAISTSVDSRRFGEAFSTNTYGTTLGKMPYGGVGTTGGQQGTGIWAVVYDNSQNAYFLYNTGTGIISKLACSAGSDAECAGGRLSRSTLGRVGVSCREGIHSFALGLSGRYGIVTISNYSANAPCLFVNSAGEKQVAVDLNWNLEADPADPGWSSNVISLGVIQHIATGDRYHVSNMSAPEKGTYGGIESISHPQTDFATWIIDPCDAMPKWLSLGNLNPPCYSGWFDMHVGWANNADGTDDVPACGSHTGYSSGGMNVAIGIPYSSAYVNEAVCFSTRPDSDSKTAWRLSHTFHSQSNRDFDTRFAVSSVSQDGKFFAWASDWTEPNGTGTLGSSSGQSTCKGGYPWRANQYYPVGAYIAPNGGMTGIDNLYGVFRAQNSGISGRAANYPNSGGQPSWRGVRAGLVVLDNGITWIKEGPNDCRGDVFIANISLPGPVASLKSDRPLYPYASIDQTHPMKLTLRNRGTLALDVSSISVTVDHNDNSTDFSQKTNCPDTLKPGYEGPLSGESCTIIISISPSAVGKFGGTLTIVDSATDSPQVVKLMGKPNP